MKKERGSILIITLTTVLFMLAFLISTYTIIANRRQSQAEIRKETKEIYEKDLENIDEKYAEYFADENAEIPIYNEEQLFQIATGNYILSGDKIYHCSGEKQYKLMQDIEFSVENTITDYSECFNETTSKWIDIEDMIREGKLTGEFNYNGNVIKETDLDGNLIIHKVRPPADILGEGTEENPYIIYSIEALIKFADNVANGNVYQDKYIILGNDLDFEDEYSYNDPERTDFGVYGYNGTLIDNLKTEGFAPIGADRNNLEARGRGFYGTFDGRGKTINNMKLVVSDSECGLFKRNQGTIKNIGINNIRISTTNKAVYLCVAGICGINYNVVEKCWVSGNITVQGLLEVGDITDSELYLAVGGIVGYNAEITKDCYNKAEIFVETTADIPVKLYVAGIIGLSSSSGILQNSYNLGSIRGVQNNGSKVICVGGCIGAVSTAGTDISNCYNLGQVYGCKENSKPFIGGIVAYMETGTINNSCNLGNITYDGLNGQRIGTIIGETYIQVTNCYCLADANFNGIGTNNGGSAAPTVVNTIAEMPTVLEIVGSEFKEDTMYINDGYPILKY